MHVPEFSVRPLDGARFGAELVPPAGHDAEAAIVAAEQNPQPLIDALHAAHGLLLLRNMHAITDDPQLLVRWSALFGPEVEDYRQTLTRTPDIHPDVPEIMLVSNIPPVKPRVPPRPTPPLTADGGFPVQFPQRRGWHTDQSFRRPPPDISLFYAEIPAPPGQGQTLYADGIAAWQALDDATRRSIDGLTGLHIAPNRGRSEQAVRAGETPDPLKPHESPQPQPVVRTHPVTGQRALYLCEAGQMDWVEGPFVGMEPGIHGDGARLLYRLMTHYTDSRFTYVHAWQAGDLVIYDNRNLIHAASWFDADRHQRRMWRTTVRGNPGPDYEGEAPSWIP